MNCTYCGAQLPEGGLFCGECGRSVTVEQLLSDRRQREYVPLPEEIESHALIQPDSAALLPDNFDTGTMEHVRLEARELAKDRANEAARFADPAPAPVHNPEPVPERDDRAGSVAGAVCEQCGHPVLWSDIFCNECGAILPTGSAPPSSAPPSSAPPSSAPPSSVLPHQSVQPVLPVGELFTLQFSTGESFTISGTGLVGRNPQAEPGEFFDHTVRVIDPGRSVSKTHLEFGDADGALWIKDRYSGNGTIIHSPTGRPVRCRPEKRYRVERGTRVEIGEQFFLVS